VWRPPLVADNDRVSGSEARAGGGTPKLKVPVVTGPVLLVLRGSLLWLVIPINLIWWLVGLPHWKRQRVTFGHLLGWTDLNLVAVLQRGPLRPLVIDPVRWTPLRELPQVTHRLRVVDPA
jgi:hypothetical protein